MRRWAILLILAIICNSIPIYAMTPETDIVEESSAFVTDYNGEEIGISEEDNVGTDGRESAQSISLNTLINSNGLNSTNEELWFAFSIPDQQTNPGYFNLEFFQNQEPIIGWKINIYDENLNSLYSASEETKNSSLKTPNYCFKQQTMYIKICPHGSLENVKDMPFQLKVNYVNSANRECEYNDDSKTAFKINLDTNYTGTLFKYEEKDWYEFTIPDQGSNPGYFNIEFNQSNGNGEFIDGGWALDLYDQNLNLIFKDSEINETSITFPNYSFCGQKFYIKVGSHYSNTGPTGLEYNVKVNYTPANDRECEYNDATNSANDIPIGKEYKGSLYKYQDVDWYKVTVSQPNNYSVKLTNKNGSDDEMKSGWAIQLYDSNQTKLSELLYAVNPENKTPACKLAAGTYYVKIASNYTNAGPENKEYGISVNLEKDGIDTGNVTLVKGETYKITGNGKHFTSSKKGVASVSSKGKVIAKKKGTAVIKYKEDGVTKTVTINVEQPVLSAKKITLLKGNSASISVNNTSQTYTWNAVKASIVTVDEKAGVITAIGKGKTKVYATIHGKKYYATIVVEEPGFKNTSYTLKQGKKKNVALSGTTQKSKIVYTISDNQIATVNAKGKVTAKGPGQTKLTAELAGQKYMVDIIVE